MDYGLAWISLSLDFGWFDRVKFF